MDGKVIVWKQAGYQPDWYARERREEARFRASERRAWITCIVEKSGDGSRGGLHRWSASASP